MVAVDEAGNVTVDSCGKEVDYRKGNLTDRAYCGVFEELQVESQKKIHFAVWSNIFLIFNIQLRYWQHQTLIC